jgi:protein-L-isoaspartate O-methyltransferase
MFQQTISRDAARRVYNALGSRLDRAARYEANAKRLALALLAPQPGQRALHLGVGTGIEQAALRVSARRAAWWATISRGACSS